MRGQYIIINRTSGDIMHGKQGVYTSETSAKRALSYWVRKESQKHYKIVSLEPKFLLSLI